MTNKDSFASNEIEKNFCFCDQALDLSFEYAVKVYKSLSDFFVSQSRVGRDAILKQNFGDSAWEEPPSRPYRSDLIMFFVGFLDEKLSHDFCLPSISMSGDDFFSNLGMPKN